MAEQVFPTKGNLIQTKKSLQLAILGYELLDRKRNVLIREMMTLIDKAKELRDSIDKTYKEAYKALQFANITMGVISHYAQSVPIDNSITLSSRSVMGIELPTVEISNDPPEFSYGFSTTNSALDKAYICFDRVKKLTVTLAEVENSIYRLAIGIKKTQRRANALKNILIPRFEGTVKFITNALEEKEREEFSRLKVIKRMKKK